MGPDRRALHASYKYLIMGSIGATFIVIGISATLIGRRDLPKASHFLGQQVGRIVGFLQGARARERQTRLTPGLL